MTGQRFSCPQRQLITNPENLPWSEATKNPSAYRKLFHSISTFSRLIISIMHLHYCKRCDITLKDGHDNTAVQAVRSSTISGGLFIPFGYTAVTLTSNLLWTFGNLTNTTGSFVRRGGQGSRGRSEVMSRNFMSSVLDECVGKNTNMLRIIYCDVRQGRS